MKPLIFRSLLFAFKPHETLDLYPSSGHPDVAIRTSGHDRLIPDVAGEGSWEWSFHAFGLSVYGSSWAAWLHG